MLAATLIIVGHPGVLLLVPALDPRPATARLTGRSMRVKVAIGLGLAIVGAGVLITLSLRAPREQGTNTRVELSGLAVFVPGHGRRCQYTEHVPGGTRALRIFVTAVAPPDGPLDVTIARPGRRGVPPRVVASASLPFGLRKPSASAPLRPAVRHDLSDAQVCLYNRGRQAVAGRRHPHADPGKRGQPGGERLPDEARVDYMRGGKESWWSVSPTVADRFGLMQTSFFGAWTMWAVFAALAGLWAATIVSARAQPRPRMSAATATGTQRFGGLRRALRRVPAACVACAAIGFAHAALWAVVTPPFQVPDEPSHVGYAQYLAETGKVPSGQGRLSPGSKLAALLGIPFSIEGEAQLVPVGPAPSSSARTGQAGPLRARPPGEAWWPTNYPPAVLRPRGDPVSHRLRRELPRPGLLHAPDVGPDRRPDGRVRLPLLARAAPGQPLGLDRGGAGGRLPAACSASSGAASPRTTSCSPPRRR